MPILAWSKALTLWVALLLVATVNGVIREKLLIPGMGNYWGTFASGVVLSASIFLVAFFTVRWYGILEPRCFWKIGMLWLALTLLFEFTFGLFIAQRTWNELLAAYMFRGGNIWPVVLVIILVSPWLSARLRGVARG
ncbi:MAG: hypothetical protein PVJ66_04515 [Gammaproteobacteria bacterium]